MAYKSYKWTNNESVTAERLNCLEQGIADAHETADVVAERTAEAISIGESNGEDIARLFDEIDALRKELDSKK